MLHDSNDPIATDLLRRLHLEEEAYRRQLESAPAARRAHSAAVIPAANRYPRSIARSELEAALQPWNRTRLGGSPQFGAYH